MNLVIDVLFTRKEKQEKHLFIIRMDNLLRENTVSTYAANTLVNILHTDITRRLNKRVPVLYLYVCLDRWLTHNNVTIV